MNSILSTCIHLSCIALIYFIYKLNRKKLNNRFTQVLKSLPNLKSEYHLIPFIIAYYILVAILGNFNLLNFILWLGCIVALPLININAILNNRNRSVAVIFISSVLTTHSLLLSMNNSRDYTARLFLDNVEIIHKDKEVISRDAENLPETIIKEEVEFNTGRTYLDFFYEEIYPFLYYYGIVFIWITSIIVSIRVSRVNGYSEKELKDIFEFLEAQKTQNK